MADIRCPSCGKNNPDFLDVCQFCQTPLVPDSTLQIGEKPTKKNTGELENNLPGWLRDARQQSRDLAEEDAVQAASMPMTEKEEPPDLLAGLAFQSKGGDEEQIPDWLSSINPATPEKPSAPALPAQPESDFFARFNKAGSAPKSEPVQNDGTSFMGQGTDPPQDAPERDELSEWFTQASEQPIEPSSLESDASQIESGWGLKIEEFSTPEKESVPKPEEDLRWLRNLEATSKQTGELSTPKQDEDWLSGFDSPSSSSQSSEPEDLSWLNNLGRASAPEQPAQQSAQSQNDLDWLNTLGGPPATEQPSSKPSQPAEDLSWLNASGETSGPAQAAPAESSSDDLSWLNGLGGTSEPSQAFDFAQDQPLERPPGAPAFEKASPQDDLGWLHELQGTSESL